MLVMLSPWSWILALYMFQVSGDGHATSKRSEARATYDAKSNCHDDLDRQCHEDHAEGDAAAASYFAISCIPDRDERGVIWWTCDLSCRAMCTDRED